MWGGMNGMWGMGWGGPWMILLWIALIAGIVFAVRYLGRATTGPAAAPRSPADVVRERYARGEIDREEYDQKLRDLEGPR